MTRTSPDTRSSILRVALQLFLQKGYKAVSYENITRKTQLSKGAIYHYFPSKQDLLVQTFEFLLEAARQRDTESLVGAVSDIPSFKRTYLNMKTEQLRSFYTRLKTRNLQFNKVLFFIEAINEYEQLGELVSEMLAQEIDFLRRCFEQLKKHGRLPVGKDPELLARGLFWMLDGAENMLYLRKSTDQAKDYLDLYQKTLDLYFNLI